MLDSNLKGEDRQVLFGAVAERVQSQLLTEDEAALVAAWFRRLAEGEEPKRVLYGETRGRKRGSNTEAFIKGRDLALPDHVDLCWTIRQAIARTGQEDEVFRIFAKHYDKTVGYLKRLYAKVEPTLAADPTIPK